MGKKLAAILLALLFLSSCGFTTGSDLLQAPILNARQAELQEALELTLNLSDILYCYPRQGEQRSPFLFADLDGDGEDEAVVLYSYADSPEDVRAKVLRRDPQGNWVSLYDEAGRGDQVDFIQFTSLLSAEELCVVIGWYGTGTQTAVLEAYSLGESGFTRQLEREYSRHIVRDFDGDGLSEIVFVGPALSGGFEIVLMRTVGGRMVQVADLPLEADAVRILELTEGTLWNGGHGVYIDEMHDNRTVATEVIGVSAQGLDPVAAYSSEEGSGGASGYRSTFRDDAVLSVDLRGDGRVLVPQLLNLPSPDVIDDSAQARLMLTEYRELTASGYRPADYAVVNGTEGYLVFFPRRWLDRVTVVQRPEIGEWQFYQVDPDTQEPELELFRVFVYTAGDYRDRSTNSYLLLDSRGAYSYYGYVASPPGGDQPLAITREEAREMFMLL